MLSNTWNKEGGESISQRVLNKVKPEEPIKNKIDFAQKKVTISDYKIRRD